MVLINDVHKKTLKGMRRKAFFLSSAGKRGSESLSFRGSHTKKKEMVMWDLKAWLIFLKDILCEKQPFAAAD